MLKFCENLRRDFCLRIFFHFSLRSYKKEEKYLKKIKCVSKVKAQPKIGNKDHALYLFKCFVVLKLHSTIKRQNQV